jgi:CubicO group peptidase (beta-lactamase class C family)
MQPLPTVRLIAGLLGVPMILAAAACGPATYHPAAGATHATQAHETRVDSIFAHFGPTTPGCAVGVYRAGDVLFAKGYGMASLEHGRPIQPETVFDVGSVSKQFTAFAIHLLVQRGRVSLDDDIRRYVPELPEFGALTTLRHLVNNTSGLRDYGALRMLQEPRWTVEHPLSRAEVMQLLEEQRKLNFHSGERYLYSNTNWLLLAAVVERVDGRSLREFLAQEVFVPLGMRRTVLRDDPMSIVPGRAATYTPLREGGYRANLGWALAHDLPGPGHIHTTLVDLARWDATFYDEVVGSAGLTEAMYTRARLAGGDTISYASGLIIGEHRGLRTVFHGGAGGGSSHLIRFPEEQLSVAVLCNQSSPHTPSHDYARSVADLFLPGEQARSEPRVAAVASLDDMQLSRFAGRYLSLETGAFREFLVHDGGLAERGGDTVWPLTALGEGRFADPDIHVVFTPDASAGTVLLTDGTSLPLRRVEVEWHPMPATLARYAGTYHSEELDVTWSIEAAADGLVLRRRNAPPHALQPLIDDLFRAGPGLVVAFHSGADGIVTRLSVSFIGALNVEFDRVT